MRNYFILFGFLFFSLTSCKKANILDDCPDVAKLTVTSNSPVTLGWPIELKSSNNYSAQYIWTGPNGFSRKGYSGNNLTESITTAAFADSGTYYVKLIDGNSGCVLGEGSTQVKVVAAANAPCTIANNTSTSTLGGVGGGSYSGSYGRQSGNYFLYFSNCSDGSYLNIAFTNTGAPNPGEYLTTGDWYSNTYGSSSVGLYYQTGLSQFIAKSLQKLYVTRSGSSTTVSFCNIEFTNSVGSTKILISAKVTF
ncbi:MAG: hypothetical protein NTZ59_03525 [Bacteroidetes bacterium]|jgi:hypothetical protein|nr:hypothetical protein [Bacteroidota bacterium]